MRIAALSDLHGHLPPVPTCDLLLLGGDLCPVTNHSPRFQARWLDEEFRRWLDAVPPATEIVGVAGNHDFLFERRPDLVPADLNWTYLQDFGCEVGGVKIYGTPWQPPFCDWAFNLDEAGRRKRWADIPGDTEILVLHGPPLGYGDIVPRRVAISEHEEAWPDGVHVGCRLLRERIEQLPNLRLAVFGHIHGGRGVYGLLGESGGCLLANVAHVDELYRPVHGAMVFEWNGGKVEVVYQ